MRLPAGIQREYDLAVERTGMTKALLRAHAYIPVLLEDLTVYPALAQLSAEPYDENKTYDELDIIEPTCYSNFAGGV